MHSHIEKGKAVNLRIGERGEPYITLVVSNEELGKEKTIEFWIDTGFNGFMQLNETDARELALKRIASGTTIGYDGNTSQVFYVSGALKMLDQKVQGLIQVVPNGTHLLGTAFLKELNKMLILDYRHGIITITDREITQRTIHQVVDALELQLGAADK